MKSILTASLLSVFLLLAGCDTDSAYSAAPEAPDPVPVAVETISPELKADAVGVPGQVRAAHAVVISSRIQGEVDRLDVVPGQAVERGEILVVLDSREIEARADRVRAELEAAALERDRVQGLIDSNAATARELEAAEARYRSARASLEEAETVLGYATVRAPFSGVITRKHVDPGDLLSPGKPIVELQSPEVLRVESWVPESLARPLALGDLLDFEIESSGTLGSGVVSEIGPTVDPATRSVLVKLDLSRESGAKSGQYARIFVPGDEARRLWVPEGSVLRRGQLEQVFIVAGDPPVARLRLIRTGMRRNGEVEVVSGLNGGEAIVIEEPYGLSDGQTVEIRE